MDWVLVAKAVLQMKPLMEQVAAGEGHHMDRLSVLHRTNRDR